MDSHNPKVATAASAAEVEIRPVLELHEVDAFYGKAQILWSISIRVDPGEVIAVIGANGAGKSTVLNTVMGRLTPAVGSVELDGKSIAGRSTEAIISGVLPIQKEAKWCRRKASMSRGCSASARR